MLDEINFQTSEINTTAPPKKGKSLIVIGNQNKGGIDIKIEVSTKFNWLQKKMWNYLLNIKIEDIKKEVKQMKLKEFILKITIIALLIFITKILDVFIFVGATDILWLLCGYAIYWVLNFEEEE